MYDKLDSNQSIFKIPLNHKPISNQLSPNTDLNDLKSTATRINDSVNSNQLINIISPTHIN